MRSRSKDTMERIRSFVEGYVLEHHSSPSSGEVARGLDMVQSTVYRYLVAMNAAGMLRYDGHSLSREKTRMLRPGERISAIIGSVPCGTPSLEEEYAESYVSLPTAIFGEGDLYMLHASGDSMTEAGIDDGDLVVVRKTKEAREGEIVVALVDGEENTLKRLRFDAGTGQVILHPENGAFADIYPRACEIQGVAVSVIKLL